MRKLLLLSALALSLGVTNTAQAHLVTKPKNDTLKSIYHSQTVNFKHARYVCNRGANAHKRWACKAVVWLKRERSQTYRAMNPVPRLAWRQTVEAWLPTYYCERGAAGWATNTGNGFYGGLQFDYGTWLAHGGGQFAPYAHLATPAQQALIASRLKYDGWPNCPNP